uniref:Bacterial blight-resistance protein Xa1 n=1 Tax=Oryza sativa subsp. japonica TaxID=39947 RepID=Q6K2T7_ORYSJ|nr:putative bacterial blight-resistance protein Xa1 [Oryza sativa Japonica Group]
MEAAIGAASWLVDKVVTQLSDELVAAYIASTELGLNMEQIKRDLMFMQGLLHHARERRDKSNPGLQGLLEELRKKADEAEDVLDELQYFIIQDQIDGTHEATPVVDDGIRGQVLHGRHALRHTIGNCLSCFSSSSSSSVPEDANYPHHTAKSRSDESDYVGKLTFNRVDMSKKIKSVIEGIYDLCSHVSNLLKITQPEERRVLSLKRPPTSSTITQNKLYGREDIFNQTLDDMCTIRSETLSVLPIVGPGGIGKTTFAQHLYNHKRTEAHFSGNKTWVCVSTNFDVVRLTQEILMCICQNRNEESSGAHETSNLDQLQKSIAEKLDSKRFLLVLDDMWRCSSEGEWESLLAPLKTGEAKGSMVIVTTRFPSIAQMVKTTKPIELQGLEDDEFFTFFEECIFGQEKPACYEDELIDIARKISKKFKGFPLAAKTVGRLLKNNLSQESWMEVHERNEWKNQQDGDGIMPALQISYDYLPFHLKKCFSYCSLYPEDYRFGNLEITYFWEALGIIAYGDQNNKADHVGLKYLNELVGNGFLMKEGDDSRPYYVMHDLLHDLARNISSQECIDISSYNFRSDSIPQSIRHVSITLQYDEYDQSFERELEKFKTKIDIVNLRTLMLFGKGNANMTFFKDLLKETRSLRVLFMHANSPESFPHDFFKLIHLRYLKLKIPYGVELSLPNAISRFHHLNFLDLGNSICILPKDMNRLFNLHLFLARKELCSNIPGIGKMKYLQRLEEYHVKKEDIGFDLSELGDLTELGGELTIFNLENVATTEEGNQAKLQLKRNLRRLTLIWGAVQQTTGSDVLDGLQPHYNLRALGIINHGGPTGPEGISWRTLPPLGQLMHLEELTLINIAGMRQFGPDFGGVTKKSFLHLKKIELVGLPELVEWVGGDHCHMFSKLLSIRCEDCPNLTVLLLPSFECSISDTKDINTIWFPNLCSLKIRNCPRLSLPPLPHTSMLTCVTVKEDDTDLMYFDGKSLRLNRYGSALAFHNLNKVEDMEIVDMPLVSWTGLQKLNSPRSMQSMGLLSNLSSLTHLELVNCDNLRVDGFDPLTTCNLKEMAVYNSKNHHPSIAADLFSVVAMMEVIPAGSFQQLEQLSVDSISAVLVAPICNLLASTLCKMEFPYDMWMESFTETQEEALQLLTSLQCLGFYVCPRLQSLPEGLHRLSSLRELIIHKCPEIRALPKEGFPASLRYVFAYEGISVDLKDQLKKLKASTPGLRGKACPLLIPVFVPY